MDDADTTQTIINNRTGAKIKPLKYCSHCGQIITLQAQICPWCGWGEVKAKP